MDTVGNDVSKLKQSKPEQGDPEAFPFKYKFSQSYIALSRLSFSQFRVTFFALLSAPPHSRSLSRSSHKRMSDDDRYVIRRADHLQGPSLTIYLPIQPLTAIPTTSQCTTGRVLHSRRTSRTDQHVEGTAITSKSFRG